MKFFDYIRLEEAEKASRGSKYGQSLIANHESDLCYI